ncbi:4Fe-4S binding protein [bacterium]|nr:4Fe-4S binding protein [bacterium]MBU1024719.1 4Fe-4S binding protein [bacterium]
MLTLNSEICTGCGICVNVCPHGVFTLAGKKANIEFDNRCIECGACHLNCPVEAIYVTKGTGCLVAIIREDILKTTPQGCG